ncbi:hypothetical protein JK361_08455 [Streptomyces sp. 5-8]|uniref:Uncharacterized protein n=1 Tax=Streptomyces musisoli TaxID=2802280 RepID=A0ABS1NWY3_9ACTN|nr:hypothetical protein [Streptomyces musisoli]MBL1104626.1 hypothetical protein [Streptomyces musisoli]
MTRAPREPLGPDGLVLDVRDRPGPAPLRFETARDGRLTVLRQGGRPLLLGALTGEGCCRDLRLHRLDGYRSPLPPIESSRMRSAAGWVHRYARWLEDADGTPVRAVMEERYGDVLAGLPYEPSGIRTWPLPGGAPAWEALARTAMFECPSD